MNRPPFRSRGGDADEERRQEHGNIIPIQGDVTSQESLAAAAQKVRDDVGYVNLLVANSGVVGPKATELKTDASLAELQEFLLSIPMNEVTGVFNVNFSGVLYTVAAFLDLLDLGNKKGNVTQQSQVITTGSIAAYARSAEIGFAYNGSKAAVTLMMKMLATYCGPKYGIRFNTLAAGREFFHSSAGLKDRGGRANARFAQSSRPRCLRRFSPTKI